MNDYQSQSNFELGREQFRKGNYAEAVEYFIQGTKECCPNSVAWLARCYRDGIIVEKNLSIAKELYHSSYRLWNYHFLSKEDGEIVDRWLLPNIERLNNVEECTTISQLVEGIGQVRVIKSNELGNSIKVRRNKNEIVVTVPIRNPLLSGIGFIEQKVTKEWVCDDCDNHFYDGYTINADLIHLQVVRGNTNDYVSTIEGRDCILQFPKDACLDYLYVQKTIHKHVKNLIFQRAQVAIPPVLVEVSERIGVPYGKCEVIKSSTEYGACNYTKQKRIVFTSKCVQLPLRSLEALCVHELTHYFILAHDYRFYHKMIELAGEEMFELDAHLGSEGKWPYVRMGR